MSLDRALCSSCGFDNPPDARFCGGCARRLGASLSASLASAAAYTPAPLAQRILAARTAIEGERKLVTVMFADIRGSLEMIADRDPEQALEILDELLRTMIDAVHRYDGTVNQVLGDGLMALFGAPIAHEDHAIRAACAALAIRDAVQSTRRGETAPSGERTDVRIGLNSGIVVITAIDNDLSVEYRAVGATTHLASRMEQIAPPGAIWLTRDTLRLAEGMIDVESVGRIAVKGVREAVEVFELKRMTPMGTRFGTRISRGLTPLAGRSQELALLRRALEDARAGSPRVVAVHGEPGVGKSRLCHEFMRADDVPECRVLAVAASPLDRSTSYAPIAALLRGALAIGHAESVQHARERVLRELAPELHEHLPVLLDLLGLAAGDDALHAIEPAQLKRRISEAVRALVRQLCAARPGVLVFEDLQWCDAEALELLEGIAADPPAPNLLLLVTSRNPLPAAWTRSLSATCELRPLADEQAEGLLRSLVGAHPAAKPLCEQLIRRTSGNPLFLEEMVRTLVDSKVLVGEPGSLTPREPLTSLQIPATVQALFAARIDRLAPDVKALVQTAAVAGPEMSLELLGTVMGLPEGDLRARLVGAVEAGLLVEAPDFPGPRCSFVHVLAHEVALGGVLHAQRTQLHVRLATALESLHRGRLDEHLQRLAEHCYSGELWEKSARYFQLAAGRAATKFANRDAVALLERGLRAVDRMPAGPARTAAAIDLRLAGLAPLVPLGEQERVASTLLEAEALAASIEDSRRQNAIRSQLSHALWMLGQHDRSRAYAERALEGARRDGHVPIAVAARFNLALASHALGDFARTTRLYRELLAELVGDLERRRLGWAAHPSVLCHTFLGSSLTFTGDFAEAEQHFERGRALADAIAQPYSRTLIRCELGVLRLVRGETQLALETLGEALEIARDNEVGTMLAPLAGRYAQGLAEIGRPQDALATLRGARASRAERLGGHYTHFYLLNAEALARSLVGEHERAEEIARECERVTAEAGERAHVGYAIYGLAQCLARAERWEHAEAAIRRALAHAQLLGMRPLAAECHLALARLAALGRPAIDFHAELAAARSLFSELGAPQRAQAAEQLAQR